MSDDLTIAGVAPQESNQTETKSGNNFVSLDPGKVAAQGAAPVLPSSGVDEERAEAVREVARYINRIAPNGLVSKKMILADMEFAADRLGRGIHANGNDRAAQGGEGRGDC